MNITEKGIIGEIVAQDYRAAEVFKNHSIDFCCQGNRTIEEACIKHNIEPSTFVSELNDKLNTKAATGEPDYKSWPADLLADYVEKKHHRYVEEKTPVLKQYLDKICSVHGGRHPELHEIKDHFFASAGELAKHMKKEELILFPFVRKMVASNGREIAEPHFGSVQNPIQAMMAEHEAEGDRFREIEKLSNSYTPPADACNTYKVTFALLKEFEDDLHLHIHLENNILFPQAVAMEQKLMPQQS